MIFSVKLKQLNKLVRIVDETVLAISPGHFEPSISYNVTSQYPDRVGMDLRWVQSILT